MSLPLPEPDATARAHSRLCHELIARHIVAAGGWLRFDAFMELALYAPGLGYYSAGTTKLGPDGDFVTAPEISPLFSECVALQCAEVLRSLGGGVILEPGAGSGVMAADILRCLAAQNALPEHYLILEPSASLQARQAATLQQRVPALLDRVRWLEVAPSTPLRGVIVANEVADALPVRRFTFTAGTVLEQGVVLAPAGSLALATRPADASFAAAAQAAVDDAAALQQPYTSEYCERLPAWTATLADWLESGAMLLFDYGFSRPEYYRPDRGSGTLRCYYRHRAHDDPLLWPGLQDITAWVDFSLLAEAAVAAGLDVAGYTTQAHFLLAAGLEHRVAQSAADPRLQIQQAAALRRLLLPGEMGDTVKVMALTRGDVAVPSAMQGRDMRAVL